MNRRSFSNVSGFWRGNPPSVSEPHEIQLPLFILVILFCLSAAPGLSLAQLTEDGMPVLDGESAARKGWYQGKVPPDLLDAATATDFVDVVIYINRPRPKGGGVLLDESPFDAEIETLGGEIRTITSRYQPGESLPEEEEKRQLAQMQTALKSGPDAMRLEQLKRELDIALDARRISIAEQLRQHGAQQRSDIKTLVTNAGGVVEAEIGLTNAIGARIPTAVLTNLADHSLVHTILHNPPVDYELEVSIPTTGFPAWHSNGLDGSGIWDLGVVDSGVQENHPNLVPAEGFYTHSATHTDPDTEVGHGTHVTGIVASNNATVRGGAPAIGAIIWEHAGNQATTMSRMNNLVSDFVQSPEVVNHSLGYGTANDVDYNANDSFYDAFIDIFNVMVTKSAGNGGWTTGDPGNPAITITHPAPAYNLLAVANMDDQGTTIRADDVRRWSSSVGPTVNGRRKPDITAPGTNITSTNFYWPGTGVLPYNACNGPGEPGTDNIDDFCILSGTSMSAPHVAAAIVLMEDGGNHSARAQKAVLLNTADAWTSNDTSTTADDGPMTSPVCPSDVNCDTLWDKSYGWGYLDMAEAYFNRNDYFTDSVVPRNDTAVEDDYELYRGYMFTDEKATMVWHKRADTYVDGGPASGQRAIGDLNIRLYQEADGILQDWDVTGSDNVQQVVAQSSGTKVIKAYAWSESFDNAASLTFTLATEENFSRVNPPDFTISPLIPIVGPYQTFNTASLITNAGGVRAHNPLVSIGNIANVTGDGTAQAIASLGAGANTQVNFSLTTTGLFAGTYYIPVTVTSNSYAETYTNTDAQGLGFWVETDPPVSQCTGAPVTSVTSTFSLSWTASDGFLGTGIDEVELYHSAPGSSVFSTTGLIQSGTLGSFSYTATDGNGVYLFATRARDVGGNQEAVPLSPECRTYVMDPSMTICSAAALNLTAADTGSAGFYMSENGISAGNGFVVETALDVNFIDAASITLDNGFTVQSGAVFNATIDPGVSCPP